MDKQQITAPEEGDRGKTHGHGERMVVVNANSGADRCWERVEHAEVSERYVGDTRRQERCSAANLEIEGNTPQYSHDEIYRWLTSKATSTISGLSAAWQTDGAADIQTRHHMAKGALKLWSDSVGVMEAVEDRLKLQALIDGMSV